MSRFDDAWLRLREPADRRARADALTMRLAQQCAERPLTVTDLAAGTGANLRYLGPLLGGAQSWQLVDHDRALLEALPQRVEAWTSAIGARLRDAGDRLVVSAAGFECELVRVEADLADRLDAIELADRSLVTASALLDLLSADWLEALLQRCLDARATVLFALSYDGRIRFEPPDAEDERVAALVNRHQHNDKGFGAALGPAAAAHAAERLEHLGFCVETARSDWRLGASDAALQAALIAGWLAAALIVGHTDTLAWLPH